MVKRVLIGAVAVITTASTAQVHQIAFVTAAADNDTAVDAGVAVSPDAVVTSSNLRLSLFDRDGDELDSYAVTDTGFPFTPLATGGRFLDPRAEYDVVNDRLWIMYPEHPDQSVPTTDIAIHLAVTRANVANPDKLDSTD